MTVFEKIRKIGEKWFLTEPLLFAAYCSHNIVENNSMKIPIRTGQRKIEFSTHNLENIADAKLEEHLKIEVFRILLKHPYQRQPPFAQKELLTLASNVTIADVCEVPIILQKSMGVTDLRLPSGLCFEEYYQLLKDPSSHLKAEGEKENNISQISELWEENQEICCDINNFIENAINSKSWGSIPDSMQSVIMASLKVEIDCRKMLSMFKTSVISSKRYLTRMRPNRRLGFDAMGSRYEMTTNLLIAVDVSGSVSDKSLEYFFSVINRLFKYGVKKLDVVQFDSEIKGNPQSFKKARRTVKIVGRGGTDFQPAADYYCEHSEYDGLIYFTDGEAAPPIYNTKRPIDVLWVLCGKSSYESNCEWIKRLKRNRVTYIPRSE